MAALSSAGRIDAARRVVIKIGSALLVVQKTGELNIAWLNSLAADVADLRARGKQISLVSSGSIALGRRVLDLPEGVLSVEQSQAAAAVGQIQLARAYETALRPHNITTAQILVTLEDSENRRRYLNSRRTLETLFDLGVVPIVNENDTVATDEIRYGDNDRLAAQVASMAGADVLVLFSDIDGLYTGNPRTDKEARRVDLVSEITPEIEAMAGGAGTVLSSGGMKTKVMAARIATQAGCAMAITEGAVMRPVRALVNGADCTWFEAKGDPQVARKRWITGMKSKGSISIDSGAAKALANGKSLLSAGVVGVAGDFGRGDPVDITDIKGAVLACALAGYDASEIRLVQGRRSSDIEALLGYTGRKAIVHRNDMVVRGGGKN